MTEYTIELLAPVLFILGVTGYALLLAGYGALVAAGFMIRWWRNRGR